eukprot:m.131997 g.131997  ORF g.131997 m.131997 type:complete len:108 (+) comp16837_c0_seq3:1239-1562(+)
MQQQFITHHRPPPTTMATTTPKRQQYKTSTKNQFGVAAKANSDRRHPNATLEHRRFQLTPTLNVVADPIAIAVPQQCPLAYPEGATKHNFVGRVDEPLGRAEQLVEA